VEGRTSTDIASAIPERTIQVYGGFFDYANYFEKKFKKKLKTLLMISKTQKKNEIYNDSK
jgi:hypothetical protein